MKKWIALIYIIVILIGLLCGCSNPVSNSQNEIIKVWAGESLIGYTEFDIHTRMTCCKCGRRKRSKSSRLWNKETTACFTK